MCGICGKVTFEQGSRVEESLLSSMLERIAHRGPDDQGVYRTEKAALGHRRLSIIDLDRGHQPLSNEDASVWIVFNGEIYNYRELRAELTGRSHRFRTMSDTEVIVHLYEEFGPQCLEKLRGMFAFAIWDARAETLFLARDRLGIKPLYYYLGKECVIFASEIKAILADRAVTREIEPDMIERFLTFWYLPGEETLLKGVVKLAPGHYLLARHGRTEVRQYWDLSFAKPQDAPDLKTAEGELVGILRESVGLHMLADVPVGVLLSGGVDSSGVLSFAAEQAPGGISTYTIGFSDPDVVDERPYATLAAKAFGTRHREITISANEFAAFLPKYVWHMEEPVCEPPAIALYYVSKFAREHVKVLLSGEGGDEAFAGYGNYRYLLWLERAKRIFPGMNGAIGRIASAGSRWLGMPRVKRYAALFDVAVSDYYYSRTSLPGEHPENMVGPLYRSDFAGSLNRRRAREPILGLFSRVKHDAVLDQLLYIDTKTWLPDDLLLKADKMTMANSLELRVPLLDHRVLEFAAALPPRFKVNRGRLKYVLKEALGTRVPRAILERTKTGFPVPYRNWLRKDLRRLMRDILTDQRTLRRGYFQQRAIDKLLEANGSGTDYSRHLFSLMVLELWHRTFLDNDGLPIN